MSEKITIPRGTFGSVLRFTNTPDEWLSDVWFSVWKTGASHDPVIQGECTLDTEWIYTIQEDDFPTVGIYQYELCQYIGGTKNVPSMSGILEVVESAAKPEV